MGRRWPVGASIDKKNSIFLGKNSHFFRIFFGFNFAECRVLGKGFGECPIKDTRQSWLCRHFFWRVPFAECYTRRTICRVFYAFCRVFRALGKLKESGSVLIPGLGTMAHPLDLIGAWHMDQNSIIQEHQEDTTRNSVSLYYFMLCISWSYTQMAGLHFFLCSNLFATARSIGNWNKIGSNNVWFLILACQRCWNLWYPVLSCSAQIMEKLSACVECSLLPLFSFLHVYWFYSRRKSSSGCVLFLIF